MLSYDRCLERGWGGGGGVGGSRYKCLQTRQACAKQELDV